MTDCGTDTPPADSTQADQILADHINHPASCLQSLVAGAFLSEGLDDV